MFYWVGKKKYDLADAQCEDSLTSSVFERLLLLSDENLWWVLRNACDKQAATTLPDNVGKLEKFEFWPSWEPDLKLERNSLRVEPDVFLRFEGLDILVEAKRYDFVQSQREEQWQNELAAWFQEFKSDRPVLLLAIGGNTSVGSCNVKLEHLTQQFRVEQLHWEMLRDAVFELSNRFSNDTQLAHLFDQLDIVFEFFGVRSLKMRWLCNLRSMAVENKVKPSQLSSALDDVRRAYRVLVSFHEMMKNTLLYIKEKYRFNNKDWNVELYPYGVFADKVIKGSQAEVIAYPEVKFNDKTYYQNVNLVGYSSVWFGGPSVFNHKRTHNQVAELWGFVVPDDRLIINRLHSIDDILTVQDAENTIGYIVLFAAINNNYITEESYNVGDYVDDQLWLVENDKDEGLAKIRELLSSPSDEKIMLKEDEKSILKRYRLEEFVNNQSTDRVLRDFAKLVLDESGIKIFKDRFY